MSEKYKNELNKKFEKIDEIISSKFGQKSNTNKYSNNNNNYSKSNSNSNNNNYSNNKVEYIVDETSAIDGGTRRLRASEIPKKIEPINKSTYYDSEGTDSSPRRVGDSLLMDILAIPFRLAIIAAIIAIVGGVVVGGCNLVLGGCSIIELPEDKKIEVKTENKIEQRKEFRIIEKAIRNKNNEKKEMGIKNEKR